MPFDGYTVSAATAGNGTAIDRPIVGVATLSSSGIAVPTRKLADRILPTDSRPWFRIDVDILYDCGIATGSVGFF